MSKSKRIAFSIIITTAIFLTIYLLIRYGNMPENFIVILLGLPAILIESTPLVAAYIILGLVFVALFFIIFFIIFLLFGIKKDYSSEISEINRVIENTKQEVKNEYLGNIDIISWEQLSDSLAQRKKLLIDELKSKYGKTNKKNSSLIESSVDSNWKDLENLFRSKKTAPGKTDSLEKEEYLDELFGVDEEDNLELLDIADENDESNVVAYSIPEDSTDNQTENQNNEDVDDIEEIEEAEAFEDLEELEEPEFINPLEVIGELEEIDDFEEINDKANFNVVEQLEEADENLEELEELVEEEEDTTDCEELEELVDEDNETVDSDELEELVENPPEDQKEFEGLEEDELEEISELCDEADDLEEIEELEEIDYKDPYPELLVNLQAKPVYVADSNLTFISSLNDNFANVENIFAEDLSIGTEYIHELRMTNTDFTFVPMKLEFVVEDKNIEELLPVDSESCFSLTRFNENQQNAVELEEDSTSTIIEIGGVFSIAEGLSYEGVQQDQSFKALVNSVIGTGK